MNKGTELRASRSLRTARIYCVWNEVCVEEGGAKGQRQVGTGYQWHAGSGLGLAPESHLLNSQ